MGDRRDGTELYLAANSTQSAATASMRGVQTTTIAAASGRCIGMGVMRGAAISIFAEGADNVAGTALLWRRRRVMPGAPGGDRMIPQPTSYKRTFVGTLTWVISSNAACAVPAGSSTNGIPFPVPSSGAYHFADTMSFVIDADFQNLINTIGGGKTIVGCFSPADDGTSGIAELVIADLFDGDLEIEILKGTATSANAVVDLTR